MRRVRTARSGFCVGARSSTRSSTVRRIVLISMSAKLAPMQRRGPPPNEAPGERGRGGLLPGDQQRHKLVAEFFIGERLTVLVTRRHQPSEDVLATVGVAAMRGNLLMEQHLSLPACPHPRQPSTDPPIGQPRIACLDHERERARPRHLWQQRA